MKVVDNCVEKLKTCGFPTADFQPSLFWRYTDGKKYFIHLFSVLSANTRVTILKTRPNKAVFQFLKIFTPLEKSHIRSSPSGAVLRYLEIKVQKIGRLFIGMNILRRGGGAGVGGRVDEVGLGGQRNERSRRAGRSRLAGGQKLD